MSVVQTVEHSHFPTISQTLRFFEAIIVSVGGSKNRDSTVVMA